MTIPLFAATLFVGSFLMFAVEPMAARQMLPVLGGTPMVWNGCVVFFQAVLLVGYAGAHILTRWVSSRMRLFVYGAVALLSFPLLNLRVDPQSGVGADDAPLGWLLLTLLSTVGPPFLILAMSSSIVQSSLAASRHKSADDPYFLYAASNAGSLAALIAYPTVIEPWLGLSDQAGIWRIAYGVFIGLVLSCAVVARWTLPRRLPDVAGLSIDPISPAGAPQPPVTWRDRALWCALAAVPSSLLLGVTTALTTDIAPVPLLWVVPLAIYLFTFIVAFSGSGPRATAVANRLLPTVLLVLAFILLIHLPLPIGPGLLVHLLPFAVAAMACHGRLADTRPASRYLTEFYLWLAFGGMVGGLFNTLLAPALFSTLLEYPIALALVAILRPTSFSGRPQWSRDIALPVIAFAMLVVLRQIEWSRAQLPYILGGVAFLLTMTLAHRQRRWAFGGVVGVLLVAAPWMNPDAKRMLHRDRTFFGAYAVRTDETGRHHTLSHGTTVHGMQALDTVRRHEPLTYYHRSGPFGEMIAGIPRLREPGEFAVIGLGVGSLAAYVQPGQRWTFYEIDAAMEQIARDERLFTFLPRCGSACDVVLGDARLSVAATEAQYSLIALDAFTSDAIPLHLLTNDAMRVYLAKLAPHGVLAVHISNRHLELAPVIARLASANGLIALHREDHSGGADWPEGKSASQWVMMARSAPDLGALTSSPRWNAPTVTPSTPLWTDDFTNLLAVMNFGSN